MPTVSVGVSPALGVATGVALPTSEGPLVIPRVPEVATTPLPMASLGVGAQLVGPPDSGKPLGDVVSHLSVGLSAYAQQCVAPPVPAQPCGSRSVMTARRAAFVHCIDAIWFCTCATQRCYCVGTSNCFGCGYPIDVC